MTTADSTDAKRAPRCADSPRAAYVHVPFCRHHCGYCDFAVIAGKDHLIPDYLTALSQEMRAGTSLRDGHRVELDSLFIGGGTPTHLSPEHLAELLALVASHFVLAPGGEYSVEANPDGLCEARLKVLCDAGVNRLSLGVQSFDDQCLEVLERQHTAREAIDTIHRCRKFLQNLSVDLIFAVPGQSEESWARTLQTAVALNLTHLSTYGLTWEQGTPFFRRERSGQLTRLPDEMERRMYLSAIDRLAAAGFSQYEVSNFSRPGFRCRHNQTYWSAGEYLAFGPGAARHVGGVRSTNCRSIPRWLRSWQQGQPCLDDSEQLDAENRAREWIMLALRTVEGLDRRAFLNRFGIPVESLAQDAIQRHLRGGLLEATADHLRLTREGFLLADTVTVDFL